MTMEQEKQNTAADFREKLVAFVPQVSLDLCVQLTPEEAALVRKVLQAANLLFTVADKEYHENKIDALLRKLKEAENGGGI